MPLRSSLVAVALSLALAACGNDADDSSAPAGEGATAGDTHPRIELADLGACKAHPRVQDYRCGSIEVPFERTDPSYGTTRIGFAVLPRKNQKQRSKGAIFAVEGGPGYATTASAFAMRALFGGLLDRRELVLIDQRGQGSSERYRCDELQSGDGPVHLLLASCAAGLGKHFVSYRTSAAADDIDAVREALGLEQITLYGDSYGTFLGQSYAYRHPDRLEALVLDSAYPAFGEDPFYPSLPKTGVRSLEITCDREPDCKGDAAARLARAVRFLRETGRGVGPLIDAIASAGYGPPDSYLAINDALVALFDGDVGPYKELIAEGKPAHRNPARYVRAGELVVGCNDYPMIWDKQAPEPERRVQLDEAIADYDQDAFAPFTVREMAVASAIGYLECLTWPPLPAIYEPPADPDSQEPTEAPTLVVSGEFDDVTTPQEGKVVAELFPDSEHYIARNSGHVDALYYSDKPAADRIRAFLRRELRASG